MYMSYTNNPKIPEVRMKAVMLVRRGWSVRKTARHLGYHHTAVMKWIKRAPRDGRRTIPTKSSRPRMHPHAASKILIAAIIAKRKEIRRCSEVVHDDLHDDGVDVSLSTVKRVLKRYGCLKQRSKWARHRRYIPRPYAEKPGDLVEIDTVHMTKRDAKKVYVFTLIDVVSRFGYAEVRKKANTRTGISFLKNAQRYAPFPFTTIQTDHGPEFGKFFRDWCIHHDMNHRHIRVRKPNDNAHIERFNRTMQEECLNCVMTKNYATAISKYLPHYNSKRKHLGLKLKTPMQMVPSY
jgi:transposase InsO family protein